jgi:hypothetical protein
MLFLQGNFSSVILLLLLSVSRPIDTPTGQKQGTIQTNTHTRKKMENNNKNIRGTAVVLQE